MNIDLTRMTPQTLATLTVLVGFAAALIAAIASVTVASINGYYARRLARDQGLREYKLQILRRLARLVTHRSRLFKRIIALRANETADVDKFMKDIDETRLIRDEFIGPDLSNARSLYVSELRPSREVVKAIHDLNKCHHDMVVMINRHEMYQPSMTTLLRDFESKAATLKALIEKDIFRR